ncbi:glycosyltransferase family 39 protein [Clostridium folliculivorans]|uniref:Dolichyl-phosphate-mannose--protein mannosyltransferase n=1 Tax=Clostridium folliculivorans TaxID=2886038 RepID=A0A9W6DCH4_9CLOT|nr:glycosyltransferase family 39 protein [Clostridium folliculivorans]GKU27314.1 dolichyl-phosphate-mannose--protein mannosyltransferase [Clostridium folliculivorans]GKU32165.1 dolichyl-phosphate-mannose--protein mannosyltransferase [Clostridium folliculivorans]
MKKIKATKENIALVLITILSAVLNFGNLGIEGTANAYYAAAAKSMTMSFKNFFFVSFDPAGFVSIDKPPLGFWLQAISAKTFGFSGWSIILPQALAGVISVVIIYHLVKRSFGSVAGLISALTLAITPVFVAVSRNNSVDNTLVMVLLLACWALTIAAKNGKPKYLILSMVLLGIGFNVKMLQAYMIAPALYITYLLSTATSIKKRILNLIISTFILMAVSLSWAFIVDLVPASSRPYVDSSTNNTVMELIVGHNGLERISLSSNSNGGGVSSGSGQRPSRQENGTSSTSNTMQNNQNSNTSNNANNSTQDGNDQMAPGGSGQTQPSGNGQFAPPSGDGQFGPRGNMQGGGGRMGGGSSGLAGSFGAQTPSSITRLFSKNILSDQIVWFIPLAILGFIAAAIKEKLRFRLDNTKKQALVLWGMWFLPVFIYFSFNTGTFHSYYLTMLAPPTAALAGIGITTMWELYKECGWKSWFLPVALLANGLVQMLMLYYFVDTSNIIKILAAIVIILCLGSSIILLILNLMNIGKKELEHELNNERYGKILKLKKIIVSLAIAGLMVTPFAGSAAALVYPLNSSFPAAGLELLSGSSTGEGQMGGNMANSKDSALVSFLEKNKTANQKYLLVVSNANSASDIIISTGEPVMAIGGFLGNDKSITLDQFKQLVAKGEVRYVMTGGMGGGNSSSSEIMNWVQQNGKLVSSSEYSDSTQGNVTDGAAISDPTGSTKTTGDNNASTNSNGASSQDDQSRQNGREFGGNSGTLYDLKAYTDSISSK